jgi:hypothetical protein
MIDGILFIVTLALVMTAGVLVQIIRRIFKN